MLSQDEIDALLRGDSPKETPTEDKVNLIVADYLTEMEQDALGEIGNISFGNSATALSTLLNQKVEITTPNVSIIDRNMLEDEFPQPYVAVQVQYTTGFSGVNILAIKETDAAIIAELMLGGDGTSPGQMLDEIHLSAVQEAMNQMMGSAATSMSAIFNKRVDISPPSIDILNVSIGEGMDNLPDNDLLVKISFHLKIGNLIDSNIMQLLPIEFAKSLVDQLLNQGVAEAQGPEEVMVEQQIDPYAATQEVSQSQQSIPSKSSAIQQFDNNTQGKSDSPEISGSTAHQPNVQPASFSEFSHGNTTNLETNNLNLLLDIPLQVTVELGRTSRSVKEILELSSGSIIELDKLAGEPVDILINNRLIAQGEVVVIDENFGVRVTEIASKSDRLKKLN